MFHRLPFAVVIYRVFHGFILSFGLINFVIWFLYVWTISEAYTDGSTACTGSRDNSVYFFSHYVAEILLYFGLWDILIYKLNRNHSLIDKYKTEIVSKYVPNFSKNGDNETERLLFLSNHDRIVTFLEVQLEKKSPFAIFGYFTPTTRKLVLLFSSVLIPMSFGIWNFVRNS